MTKRLFPIIIFILLSCFQIYAQSVGVKGGFNFAKVSIDSDYDDLSEHMTLNTGFTIGATFEFPIKSFLSINSDLLMMKKGYLITEHDYGLLNDGEEMFRVYDKTNIYYLNIPVRIKFAHSLKNKLLFIEIGPYLGIALKAIQHYNDYHIGEGSERTKIDIHIGGDNGRFKRTEVGISIGAGIEIKKLKLGFYYDYGLTNIQSKKHDYAKIYNRNFGIAVTYKLFQF